MNEGERGIKKERERKREREREKTNPDSHTSDGGQASNERRGRVSPAYGSL